MLADTTLLIDFLRGKEEAISIIRESEILFTTEINVFELITGAYISKRNINLHLDKLFAMISQLNVLPLNRKCSMEAGKIAGTLIKQGRRIEETDCLIAGIALASGVKEIVTLNTKHFEKIPGLKVTSY